MGLDEAGTQILLAMDKGIPMFNDGQHKACADVYEVSAINTAPACLACHKHPCAREPGASDSPPGLRDAYAVQPCTGCGVQRA